MRPALTRPDTSLSARGGRGAATVAVALALIVAGCVGSVEPPGTTAEPETAGEDEGDASSTGGPSNATPSTDAGTSFCDPPFDYFSTTASESPLVNRTDNGSQTVYRISDDGLQYRDKVYTVAFRAQEDLQVGYTGSKYMDVDRSPPQGWMHHSSVLIDAPVCTFDDRSVESLSAENSYVTSLWRGEGDVKARATWDGETVVERSRGDVCLSTCQIDFGTHTQDLVNLSAGEWVLVRTGGMPTDRLGDETRVETRVRVTGDVQLYSPPAEELIWGIGWGARLDEAGLHVEAGTKEFLRDGTVLEEMESARFLSIMTLAPRVDQPGRGQGQIVFAGHNQSIPNQSWLQLSHPQPGRIGFQIEQWHGKPEWYLMDTWLPATSFEDEDEGR